MSGLRRPAAVHVLGCLAWLVVLGWLSSLTWFLCDDAFISFRYARNLLEGHGLVFNPGEYVEGYSNFLWVLELAALWGVLGIRPEQAAPWLSVVCTAGTLAAMLWWVAGTPGLRHRGWVAWMALGLVCSSATFAVWTSGGGLETRQFTLLVTLAVVCLLLYGQRRWGLLAASLSLAAAAYTRPEGPLIAACCFGWFVVQRLVETGPAAPGPAAGAGAGLAGRTVCRAGGGAFSVPLRLLRRVAAQHLLRQTRARLVRDGLPLSVGCGAGDRPVSAAAAGFRRAVRQVEGATRFGVCPGRWCASSHTWPTSCG